jgi:hypothetical protein
MPNSAVLGLVGAALLSLAVFVMAIVVMLAASAESRRRREFSLWLDDLGERCDRAIESRINAVSLRIEHAKDGNANALSVIMNRLRRLEERAFGQ